MSPEHPDSLGPVRGLEAAWRQFVEAGGERPDWRGFLPEGQPGREQLINLCLADIELRLTIGKETPPVAQDHAVAAARLGLDANGQFELLKFEYEWCWENYAGKGAKVDQLVRPALKDQYRRVCPALASRIEQELKARWWCSRCDEYTQGRGRLALLCASVAVNPS